MDAQVFEAVYENGALYPTRPLGLSERQHVTLILATTIIADLNDLLDIEYLQYCSEQADDSISLDVVQASLAPIKDSLTADFILEREER